MGARAHIYVLGKKDKMEPHNSSPLMRGKYLEREREQRYMPAACDRGSDRIFVGGFGRLKDCCRICRWPDREMKASEDFSLLVKGLLLEICFHGEKWFFLDAPSHL